jgi:hypothetical protein
MALKSFINRLKKKHNWDGKNPFVLLTSMFAKGRKKIENRIVQETSEAWKKKEKTIGKIDLPNASDFLTSNTQLVTLSILKGQKVTDDLKANILNDLKRAIESTEIKTKEGGLLSEEVINKFQSNITETFDAYKGKGTISEGKIKSIAVTESRDVINKIKYDYAQTVLNNNPDIILFKEWQHYPSKSKEPRKGHAEKNKEQKQMNELYVVNYYKKVKGAFVKAGQDYMKYPHDSNIGARQNANCHCDISFNIKRKQTNE